MEKMTQLLVKENKAETEALVIAGSGCLKDELVAMLSPRMQENVKKVVSVGNSGIAGLNEAMDNTRDLMEKMEVEKNKSSLDKFYKSLSTGEDDMVSYGEKGVMTAVEAGAASRVLVWEAADFVPWLIENCPEFDTKVQIFKNVSSETNMLVKSYGGVCAFHRFSFDVTCMDEEENNDHLT